MWPRSRWDEFPKTFQRSIDHFMHIHLRGCSCHQLHVFLWFFKWILQYYNLGLLPELILQLVIVRKWWFTNHSFVRIQIFCLFVLLYMHGSEIVITTIIQKVNYYIFFSSFFLHLISENLTCLGKYHVIVWLFSWILTLSWAFWRNRGLVNLGFQVYIFEENINNTVIIYL